MNEILMRYVLSILVVLLAVTIAHSQSQDKASPLFIVPFDSVDVLQSIPNAGVDITAVPIPMYNPSVDAKMQVWWPDTGIEYKMPNLLAPEKKRMP